jgi:hypothetical protein
MNKEIIQKIKDKREFSQIPKKDIEIAYKHFARRQTSEEEKINFTKELLRRIFSVFMSKKLLSLKDKEPEWILRKHISTKERLPYYEELYERIFKNYKKASVIDLGAGINGFSYEYVLQSLHDTPTTRPLKDNNKDLRIDYTAIESVGQLVDLMNFYFKKEKILGKAYHLSLFELDKVKEIIKKQKTPRVIFMFKIIDALESLKENYSKKLIVDFIKDNFNVKDDFEIGGERYIVFQKTKTL